MITHEEYDTIWSAQGGLCALCGISADGKRLAVDHDHSAKQIRALLCMDCNTGIGKLRDDPALLRRAADYIERHSPMG